MDTLGKRLRRLRQYNRMSQEQVAKLLDVSKNAISQYERDMRQPSYDILKRLVSIYHTSADFLLGCSCEQTIELTGLDETEVSLVTGIVASMSSKNRQFNDKNSVGGVQGPSEFVNDP